MGDPARPRDDGGVLSAVPPGRVLDVVRMLVGREGGRTTDREVADACEATVNDVGPSLFYLRDTGHLRRDDGYWALGTLHPDQVYE